MTSFRLFQTGKVCREQFQFDENDRTPCFTKFVLQTCKNKALFRKGLTCKHL